MNVKNKNLTRLFKWTMECGGVYYKIAMNGMSAQYVLPAKIKNEYKVLKVECLCIGNYPMCKDALNDYLALEKATILNKSSKAEKGEKKYNKPKEPKPKKEKKVTLTTLCMVVNKINGKFVFSRNASQSYSDTYLSTALNFINDLFDHTFSDYDRVIIKENIPSTEAAELQTKYTEEFNDNMDCLNETEVSKFEKLTKEELEAIGIKSNIGRDFYGKLLELNISIRDVMNRVRQCYTILQVIHDYNEDIEQELIDYMYNTKVIDIVRRPKTLNQIFDHVTKIAASIKEQEDIE